MSEQIKILSQRHIKSEPHNPTQQIVGIATQKGHELAAQELIDQLPIGVFVFRVAALNDYVCRMANSFLERILGFERHHILGLNVKELPILRQGEPFQSQFALCVQSGQSLTFEWQHSVPPEQHHYACQVTPIFDDRGEIIELLGTVTDRSTEKRAEKQIQHNAMHDHLTGLPNRLMFHEYLENAIERSKKDNKAQCAVLMLNVDRFQLINESLGHIAGDEFLIALATRLKNCMRCGDRLARFNGDEFAILVDHLTDFKEALSLADNIHKALREPFNMGGQKVYATISVGVASTHTSPGRAEDMIRDADFAMHRAKLSGKARTETYRYAVHHQARSLFQLESELRRAIDMNELQLHYQPIIDLRTNRLTGFEALARWPHPTRGMVSPLEFIPIAEETGLIIPLGRWALKEACQQLCAWREEIGPAADEVSVGVNVSGIQFARDDIVSAVHDVLRETGLDGHSLRLELTESALVENPDLAANILRKLKELHIKLALDDFGTGYSSLSYLQRFPFDVLKIDRSFVRDVELGGENYKLVEIMVMLAQRLRMNVVAEGIETAEQIVVLKSLSCHYGQGFYYAKPLNPQQAADFIVQHGKTHLPG